MLTSFIRVPLLLNDEGSRLCSALASPRSFADLDVCAVQKSAFFRKQIKNCASFISE